MKTFKAGEIPDYTFRQAVKKPVPVRCIQINEPFEVQTMEGMMRGKAGDYLIIGIRGEMYPCDQSIFKETYNLL